MKIRRIIFPLLTLIWLLVIFFFSSQNGEESAGLSNQLVNFIINLFYGDKFQTFPLDRQEEIANTWSLIIRKGAHFTIFGILASLFYFSIISFRKNNYAYFISFGLTFIYAGFDEFHQSFSAGRGPRFTDVLIDSAGALFFLVLIFGLSLLFKKSKNSPLE